MMRQAKEATRSNYGLQSMAIDPEHLKQTKMMLDQKHSECEEWKNRLGAMQNVLNNKDKGAQYQIDQLQGHLSKLQKMHELK